MSLGFFAWAAWSTELKTHGSSQTALGLSEDGVADTLRLHGSHCNRNKHERDDKHELGHGEGSLCWVGCRGMNAAGGKLPSESFVEEITLPYPVRGRDPVVKHVVQPA